MSFRKPCVVNDFTKTTSKIHAFPPFLSRKDFAIARKEENISVATLHQSMGKKVPE